MAVTKKRVKVNKNKKKSWNKHCDIKDVEEYLEEKRFDERIGGPVSEKSDAELFCIQKSVKKTGEPTRKVRKTKFKPLKCYQSIGSFSEVPPPINPNINRYSKRIKNALERAIERKCKKILAQPPKPEKKVREKTIFENNFRDIWADEKPIDPELKDLVEFHEEMTNKRTPKVPKHRFKKPSLLPAVEVPHAGASYNPTYKDHQELLNIAHEIELKKEKQELHLKRVLTDMFPSKKDAPTQESILLEMSQGLFDEPDDGAEEPEPLYTLRNPPVSFENRLPRSRKRKRKELKKQERLRALEKLKNKRINDIYRLRSIKAQLKHAEEVSAEKHEKKCEKEKEKLYLPRTLSSHKYEAPDLEINLQDEITGSLRCIKTEGNLLEDRYKSLQRRNLIEPRVRQNRKRSYKLKVKIKRGHRDFE